MKEFDLSEADAIAAIEANLAVLKANATPEIKYEWQHHAERIDALEAEAERWYREYLKASGLAAHYKKALDSIASQPYYTSEGVAAARTASIALSSTPVIELTNNETEK